MIYESIEINTFGQLVLYCPQGSRDGFKGQSEKMVIYWITNDKRAQRDAMDELGVGYVSVNGESDYNGDAERLESYVEKGLMKVRIKKI